VNKSYPEEEFDGLMSRKILADIFIDDRNINGLPPWGEIYHQLAAKNRSEARAARKDSGLLKIFKKLK